MAFFFVITTVLGMVFAYLIYGGPMLDAVAHLQQDLLMITLCIPAILIPILLLRSVFRNKPRAAPADALLHHSNEVVRPAGREKQIEEAADKLLRDAGYNPDAIRGRTPRAAPAYETGKPLRFK
jgi:hypothetical protein